MISYELADDEAQCHEACVASCRLQSEGLILGGESGQERDSQDRGGDGVDPIEDQPAVRGHRKEREACETDESGQLRRRELARRPEGDRELERCERHEHEDGHIDSDETDEDPGRCQRRQQDLNRPGSGQDDRRSADRADSRDWY